jgi:DNA-directed RNA polymerase subunit omega
MRGAKELIPCKNKAAVVSLREIAAGKVRFHRDTGEVVNEYIQEKNAARG